MIVYLLLSILSFADSRVKIAVIDTGVNVFMISKDSLCKDGHKDFTEDNNPLLDRVRHGTSIATLVEQGLDSKKQCLLIVKYSTLDNDKYKATDSMIEALNYVLTTNAKYVNISSSGIGAKLGEYLALFNLVRRGTKVAVASGNDGINLTTWCKVYPGCYPLLNSDRFKVVGSNNTNGNYGLSGMVYESGIDERFGMRGTSQATANYMARWIKGK